MTSSQDFGDNDLSGINSIYCENDVMSYSGKGMFANGVETDGPIKIGYRSVAVTPHNSTSADSVLGVQLTPCTINLDASSNYGEGRILIIKDELGGASAITPITIAANGLESIDGAPNVTITTAYGVLRLMVSSTGNWMVI